MPIPLNQNQNRPSVKLPYINCGIEVAVIGTRQIPWTEFGTNAPKLGTNGQQRKQLRITGICVSQQGAVTGPQGQERPVNIGETVDLYLHGQQWGSYIEAERAFTTAGFTAQVGDILLQHFTHTEPSSQQGANDKKVKACTLRRARPDEMHYVAQAEAAYFALGFDKADPDAGPADTSEPFPPSQPQYGQSNGYPPQQPQQQPQPQYGQQPQQQPQTPVYGQQPPPQPQYGQQPPQQPPASAYGQQQPQPTQPSPYAPANPTGF